MAITAYTVTVTVEVEDVDNNGYDHGHIQDAIVDALERSEVAILDGEEQSYNVTGWIVDDNVSTETY